MRKISFFLSVMLCASIMSFTGNRLNAQIPYDMQSPEGYGAGTTGGGTPTSSNTVTVSSASSLLSALTGSKSVILVSGTISTARLDVQVNNKTIIGLPGATLVNLDQTQSGSGILTLKPGSGNVIIRNLIFVGPGAYDVDGWDLISNKGCVGLWVDHCEFQDGVDDCFDNTNGSDNITVSWCKFTYLKPPKAGGSGGSNDHRFACLVGGSDSDYPSDGHYSITWEDCWWGPGCVERMVRGRNSQLHILDCYWNSQVAKYDLGFTAGTNGTSCYVENGVFASTGDVIQYMSSGSIDVNFVNCTNGGASSGTVSKPSYSYTVIPTNEVVAAVTNSSCGAGATLQVSSSGTISSSCQSSTCTPTTITPYVQIDGGSWSQTSTATVNAGQTVTFGPQPTSGGSWSWSGPNGFSSTSRQVSISNVQSSQAGNYVTTYTNDGGCASSQTFTINVNGTSSSPATLTKHGSGSSSQTVSVGTAITSFYYAWTNATSATATGLPSGVSYSVNSSAQTITISGTPTVSGTFNFTVTTTGGSPNASKSGTITVTGSSSSSPVTLTIQENATGFCSVDGTIDNNHTGYTGSGFANTANATGDGITWSVNVPSSGNYDLVWRYANGGSTDRTGQVMVDGSTVVPNVSMPSTGSWNTWATSSSTTVSLSAGTRLIRLQATNSSGLSNIDYMDITGNNPIGVSCTGQKSAESNTIALDENAQIQIYPNPVNNGILNIALNNVKGASTLRILNVSGEAVLQKEIQDKNNIHLDVNNLNGLYILQLINANETFVKKVMIR